MKQTTFLHWIILLVVAVIETRVMWTPALLDGHSARLDLARMVEFDAAIRVGDWLPIWSPDFYHGYGSPLFQFYSPLAYFFTELPVLAGLDIPSALKFTQLLTLFVSGLAMYQLAARHLSRWAACFGAVLYMVAPYRIVDIFVRHALAEHCAFLWLPLIVLGTERFVTERSRLALATGLLATAGLLLTHNVMALIGLPTCVAAGWALGARDWNVRNLLIAALPAALGVGLATFFWWPSLSSRALTHAEESLTGGYFSYQYHFTSLPALLSFGWAFGVSGPGAAEKMPMQIGTPHLLAGLGALLVLLRKRRASTATDVAQTRWIVAGIAIMAGATLMCLEMSQPFWAALPLVKYVQFPWRFLGLVIFGAALCGAAIMDYFSALHPRWEVPAFAAGLIAVLAAYFPYYSDARFLVVDDRTNSIASVTGDQVEALEGIGALGSFARLVTPESMRLAGERATSGDDFLPRDVQQKPTQPPTTFAVAPNGEIRQSTRPAQNHYRLHLAMREPGPVELQQFWFPGWTAWIDGRETTTSPSRKTAVVSCAVPAGEHLVEFRYLGLPQRRTGLLISWLSAAAAALVIIGAGRIRHRQGGAF